MMNSIWLKALGGFFIITATVFGIYHFTKDNSSENDSKNATESKPYVLPELNENGEKIWADADKQIKTQVFTITKPQNIITEDGIEIEVPENAFKDKNGNIVDFPIDIEIREAIKADDILLGGLETKSGEKELETGGMFYINATKDGENLDIAEELVVAVPTNEVNPEMELYDGVRKPDGSIDWVNPKPIIKELTPVDVLSLDFYPEDYLTDLQKLGEDTTNKTFTDSLYYSFAKQFTPDYITYKEEYIKNDCEECEEAMPPRYRYIYKTETHSWKVYENIYNGMLTKDMAEFIGLNVHTFPYAEAYNYITLKFEVNPKFKSKENNSFRGTKKIAKEVFLCYNKNHKDIISINSLSEDFSYTIRPFNTKRVKNKNFDRTFELQDEITFLIPLQKEKYPYKLTYDLVEKNELNSYSFNLFSSILDTANYNLNPAKIKTIWDRKYNNTFVATKQFEERIRNIHNMCKNEVLDIYLSHLDWPLYKIDSLVATTLYGDEKALFENYYYQYWGKVDFEHASLKNLQSYYNSNYQLETKSIAEQNQLFWNTQNNLNNQYNKQKNEHKQNQLQKEQENLQKEIDINLEEAYRQVGKPKDVPVQVSSTPKYNLSISRTGWNNIDRVVREGTIARKTIEGTWNDKTYKIEYEKMDVNITNFNEFDKVYTYVVPKELNSYHKLKGTNGNYTYNLNELMSYDIIAIGYKGDKIYFAEKYQINSGNHSLTLKYFEEKLIREKLRKLSPSMDSKHNIQQELIQLKEDIKYEIRAKSIKKRRKLANDIEPSIFNCKGIKMRKVNIEEMAEF